ncbi:MAG: glutaminase [Bosea sp. (in: a-proteobacteria)]
MLTRKTIEAALRAVEAEAVPLRLQGRVADYIPALGRVPADRFGLSIMLVDGSVHELGQAREAFSIQSISKLFTLALAVDLLGDDAWARIGRSPTNAAFNALGWLETEQGRPYNPFVNAGALAVTDLILNRMATPLPAILNFIGQVSDDDEVDLDFEVAESERQTCDRNAAIAHLMRSYGTITGPVEQLLDLYCEQCAIAMNARQLATAGLIFATGGVDARGRRVLDPVTTKRINALLAVAGMYDAAGEFAFRVGLPAKSGVGGGILAIVPGVMSIAVWSPGLDAQGNSLAGVAALEVLSRELELSVFRAR